MLAGFVDAHTHLFPDGIYRALWKWFDANAWSIQFRGNAEAVLEELARIGTQTTVALIYAHKPGIAEALNAYLSQICASTPSVVGVGTVLPGEPDALRIAKEAITKHKLRGIKLHCHVQKIPIDHPSVVEILSLCAQMDVPAVVHCGREPATTAYGVNPHDICHVDRARDVLRKLPALKLVVPHVGADEYDSYMRLLDQHEGLYLDTSMSCAEYFEDCPAWEGIEKYADRIMYGSDFPIVPYETDRELRALSRNIISDGNFMKITRGTARRLWRI